jgi:2-dehydro-3-deoxygluconokinase
MDLVTFGEAMVRLSPPAGERLDDARRYDAHVGGSELNVAAGAARLGLRARWVSRLPENPVGRLIARRAGEAGVDVSRLLWATGERAGLYFVELGATSVSEAVHYDRANSAMSRLGPGAIDWPGALAGARWFHMSGITPALSATAAAATAEALRAAKQAGLTVSYDVNFRPQLWTAAAARTAQEPLLPHVDVLITSQQDPGVVFGIAGADEVVARTLQERFRCRAVVVTQREPAGSGRRTRSAVALADGTIHRGPRRDVKVVDPIGAGDAFCAGLIASLLRSGDWDAALRSGVALAALKYGVPGDFSAAGSEDLERALQDLEDDR